MGDLVGRSLAHFRIEAEIGEGGMGVVYRATDEKLRRQVALKVLPDSFAKDEDRRRRFLREARSAAAITHANIATVHDVGEADGHVYIAMELVDGETLRARIDKGLSIPESVRIAKEIARGLSRAHEKGIVHRDLKPENVMITRHDEVKILDFGLAKVREERSATPSALEQQETATELTRQGRVVGTPAYMSPEQARGKDVDARADVFAFGVVLHEMVTGVRPFVGETTQDVLTAIMRDTPQRASEVNPLAPPELDRLIERCLEKQSDARYADGQELLDALSASLTEPRASEASTRRKPPNAPTLSLVTPGASTVATGGRATRWRWLVSLAVLVVAGVSVGYRVRVPRSSSTTPAATSLPASKPPPVQARRLGGDSTWDAVLSPDGSQLVYIDGDDGDRVWVQAVVGGARKRLGTLEAHKWGDLAFLPDGQVLRAADDLWVAPLDGSPAHQLPDRAGWRACSPSEPCHFILSPDGKRVAVRRERGILIAPFEGDAPVTTLPTLGFGGGELVFSPDARHIAYFDANGRNVTLTVVSVDGTASTKLLDTPVVSVTGSGSFALAWPDAHRIVFGTRNEADRTCALREMAVDGDGHSTSPPRDLWVTRGDEIDGLTTAGGRMVVSVTDTQYQVFFAALRSEGSLAGPPRQLTTNRAWSVRPRWLSDGRIAFVSTQAASTAIYAQGLDDAEAALLVAPPLTGRDMIPLKDVLHTGELLYLRPVPPDGGAAARLFGMIPGRSERAFDVLANPTGFALQCAAGDPSRCVVAVGSPTVDLSRIDLATGRAEPRFARSECGPNNLALDPRASSVAVAPDGKTVALVCGDDRIRIATVQGGVVRTLAVTPALLSILQSISFAPDGRSLVVTGIGGKPTYAMLAVGLDGRARVLLSSETRWLSSPIVSPDGKMLAWHEKLSESESWVLDSPESGP